MPFVIDASALFFATSTKDPAAQRLLERLRTDTTHAPHLIDAEMGSITRRHVARGEMELDLAVVTLSTYPALINYRYELHGLLAGLAWELRENLTFYDALYVGLGSALGLEVVTADTRMARARSLPAKITIATG